MNAEQHLKGLCYFLRQLAMELDWKFGSMISYYLVTISHGVWQLSYRPRHLSILSLQLDFTNITNSWHLKQRQNTKQILTLSRLLPAGDALAVLRVEFSLQTSLHSRPEISFNPTSRLNQPFGPFYFFGFLFQIFYYLNLFVWISAYIFSSFFHSFDISAAL